MFFFFWLLPLEVTTVDGLLPSSASSSLTLILCLPSFTASYQPLYSTFVSKGLT